VTAEHGLHARGRNCRWESRRDRTKLTPLNILFVTSRLPGGFQGDRVRAYHQLRLLGQRHRVTLVAFAGPRERPPVPLEVSCARVVTIPLSRPRSIAALLRRGLSSLPLQVAIYEHGPMRRAIAEEVRREAYDVAHIQLARMAPYLGELSSLPRVVDLVDALSLNMQRRACHDRTLWGCIARLEAARLVGYERAICREADRALVGSPADREALGSPPALAVVTSGVDLAAFPYQPHNREPRTIILSGNMGYFPNVEAALWLAEAILPIVERAVDDVRLCIVGARPHRRIRRLARRHPRIALAGDVEEVGAHLRRATVAVAPIRAGSGQQLKVLEAMASGTPVVATTLAAAGIEARDGEHLLVADAPEAFARHVVRVLRDPTLAGFLAANGRRLVEERYTWERSVGELERIYRDVSARAR
jgi:sugar transferase (PEP-CTERM/EpsH1 system associated)